MPTTTVAPKVTYTNAKDSMYAKTPIIGRFMDFYVPILIPPDPSDNLFVIRRQDWVHRPDLMAFDYYGDEMLFWVFGVRNGLADLVFDIEIGSVLFFPTSARLSNLGISGSV